MQNEREFNEQKLIKYISSTNKDKISKVLKYSRENFSSFDQSNQVKIINYLPQILRNNSNEIIDLTLDLIKLVYQLQQQKYLNIKEVIQNILEKGMLSTK